jgi:hypothetical protein
MTRKFLRRYTDLPALIYLLRERVITLLDPQSWDDSNDSYYLGLYKEKKELGSVLALCFTQAAETYHHWRVFANGSSGICITFHRTELLDAVRKLGDVRSRNVKYLKLTEIRNETLKTEDLPFLKRFAFEHEDEYRMIYESPNKSVAHLDVRVPLSCIDRITLSPWIHEALSRHVKETLWSIEDCGNLKIVRSTLISNEEWKNLGESAV